MSLVRRVAGSSFIYATTTLLQRGIAFLLLPLYTRFLTPEDYGVLAVVGALSTFLVVFCSLSMHGAVNRYYFLYRDSPEVLKDFLGTVIVTSLMTASGFTIALLAVGEWILAPVYGAIPFWPYVVLGIATAAFQPVSLMFLAMLQARQEVKRYAFHSLAQFGLTVMLVIAFVVLMRWDARGPLLAGLLVAALYCILSLYLLRHEYRVCFKPEHFRSALSYSLPLIPHTVASQVTASFDRIMINGMVSTAAAGLYNIGASFGGVMAFMADGMNRAYGPVAMDSLQAGDRHRLDELAKIGLMIIAGLSLAASALSLFAKEAVALLTAPAFHDSYAAVPWIAFSFVASGVYYLFVNIFFFNVHLTKIIAVATLSGAVFNIGLNYALVKLYGLIGAAVAALLAKIAIAMIVAVLGRRYDPVTWNYTQIALIPLICLVAVLMVDVASSEDLVVAALEKMAVLCALVLVIGQSAWRDPLYLMRSGMTAARDMLGALKVA
ncbi:MAG: oligosaccharide flippase family protein [Nitrospira sp.]